MRTEGRDLAGMLVAAVLIVVGAVVLYDVSTYRDQDSKVFPRTVALVMMGFSALLIVRNLVWPTHVAENPAPASVLRRVGLVAVMLASAALLPYLGMLVSAVIAFLALMALAMFDPWTRFRLIVYPVCAVAIVIGFHVLFGQVLKVPLPVGALFD